MPRWELAAENIAVKIRWFGLLIGYLYVNLAVDPILRAPLNAILGLGAGYALLDSIWSLRGQVFLGRAPLIVSATEASRLLWGARSAPLGSDFHADRLESVDRLEDGERLVLYTDGLIERRHEEIDLGLARLVNRSQHDVASLDFVDRLCNDMGVDGTGDDICVLSVALVRSRSFATSAVTRDLKCSSRSKPNGSCGSSTKPM